MYEIYDLLKKNEKKSEILKKLTRDFNKEGYSAFVHLKEYVLLDGPLYKFRRRLEVSDNATRRFFTGKSINLETFIRIMKRAGIQVVFRIKKTKKKD